MRNDNLPLLNAISKSRLVRFMKTAGIQAYLFDPSLFSLEYEGLEYRMRVINNNLYLESVVLLTDVIIERLKKHEIDEHRAWLKERDGYSKNPF